MNIISKTYRGSVLLVGEGGALLLDPQSTIQYVDGHDDVVVEAVTATLLKHPTRRILLLVDSVDIELAAAHLPAGLKTADKHRLLTRRQADSFSTDALKTSVLSLVSPDESVIACLHSGGVNDQWLARLTALSGTADIVDIALLPLESAGLAACLYQEAGRGWTMLLSMQAMGGQHGAGGLRQIVIRDGLPVFTRLTTSVALADGSTKSYAAAALALDVQAACDYLARQGLAGSHDLNLVAILPREMHPAMADLATAGMSLRSLTLLTPDEAAYKAGLRLDGLLEGGDVTADMVYMLWVKAQGRARHPITTSDMQKRRYVAAWTRRGQMVAVAAAIMALLLLVWQGHASGTAVLEARKGAANVMALQCAVTTEQAAMATAIAPVDRLRLAVAVRREFELFTPSPWTSLQQWQKYSPPEGTLQKLEWQSAVPMREQPTVSPSLRLTIELSPEQSEGFAARVRKNWPENVPMPELTVTVAKDGKK